MSEWELSKENYMPLKRGRDATALAAVQHETEAERKAEILNFEKLLRTDEASDDPLQTWITYVRWTEEHYPTGNGMQLRKLLEKCIKKFQADLRYVQDPRLLYIWLKFAHCSSSLGPLGIYEHMQSTCMCTQLSQFYMQWAHELELANDWKKAGEIFRMGIEAQATPLEKLITAYDAFQDRVARSLIDEGAPDSPEDTRMFLGVLKGVGKSKKTPVLREAIGSAGTLPSAAHSTNKSTFFAFNENDLLARPEKIKRLKGTPTSSTDVSNDQLINKENFKAPAPWVGQKLGGPDRMKRHSSASAVRTEYAAPAPGSTSGPGFAIYHDQTSQSRRQTITGVPSALKPQKGPMYHPLARLEDKKDTNIVHAYCHDRVYAGECEFSFEELRFMDFVPKNIQPVQALQPISENISLPNDVSSNANSSRNSVSSRQCARETEKCDSSNEVNYSNRNSSALGKSETPQLAANLIQPGRRSAFAAVVQPSVPPSTSCAIPVTSSPCNRTNDSNKEFQVSNLLSQSPQISAGNRFIAQQNEPSPNGSMTNMCYRQAMAVFSDTIQPLSMDKTQSQINTTHVDTNSRTEVEEFEVYTDGKGAHSQGSQENESAPFEVFTEPSNPFEVFVDDDCVKDKAGDKENRVPCASDIPIKSTRTIGGVLSPSPGFKTSPEGVESMDTATPFLIPFMPESNCNPGCAPLNFDDGPTYTGQFDLDEPTLARFGSVVPCDRVMSTPFDGFRVPPPSFSATKPWEMNFAPCTLPAPQMDVEIEVKDTPMLSPNRATPIPNAQEENKQEHKTPVVYVDDDRLSVIQESSREFRSGSSCLSSGGSSVGSVESGKKRPAYSAANTGNLKPIAELSYNSSSATAPTTPAYECTFPAQRMHNSGNKSEGKKEEKLPFAHMESAVKRLSLEVGRVQGDLDESVERTGTGFKMSITSGIDPWDASLIANLLFNQVGALGSYPNFHMFLENTMPRVKIDGCVDVGGERMVINRLLGEGAFARAYVITSEEGKDWVLKAQKPGCAWEFYICEELNQRLHKNGSAPYIVHSIMAIRDFFLYVDGSFLVNEYHNRGTLLDLVNYAQAAGRKGLGERLSLYFLIQLMKIIEATHKTGIIHADVKPDNVLLIDLPQPDQVVGDLLSPRVQSIKLIDWGRAIDMCLLPEGTTFKGTAQTSGFICPEMIAQTEWTYQTDVFGLIATVHVLLFGTYMKIYKVDNIWKHNTTFMRRWNTSLWKELFHNFMNIESCSELPNIPEHRANLEAYLRVCVSEERDNWIDDVRFINQALGDNRR